jgi:imidazolonepropionase-like amidohydrolase
MLDYQCPAKKESGNMKLRQQLFSDTEQFRLNLLIQETVLMKRISTTKRAAIKFATIALGWVLLVVMTPAQAQQGSRSNSLLLENARLIIGDGSVIEAGSILIEDANIVAVGNRDEMNLPDNVTRLDLAGKSIIPALIDAHAHLGYEAYTSWGEQNYSRENLIDHLQRYAYYGFSAVFSAGSDPGELAFSLQRELRDDQLQVARFLFAAGMAPPGQGPNDQFLKNALALEQRTGMTILYGVGNEQQAIDAVSEIADRGIPLIKIWVDDRAGTQQKLAPALYRVIIAEATRRNIPVFVHQQYAADMPDLIRSGVDGFLHGRIGNDLDQAIAQQLVQAKAFVVPNLGLAELRREAIGEDSFLQASVPISVAKRLSAGSGQRQLKIVRSTDSETELKASFASLIEAGVDILLGTDAGAVPDHFFGYSGHRELEIFVRLGMTPMQALLAATSRPAQRLGLVDLGQLKPGYSADLVVLDSNPLDDIRNTRRISRVYLRGKEIDRESMSRKFSN